MATKRKKTEKRVTYEVERFSLNFGGWRSTGLAGYGTIEAAKDARDRYLSTDLGVRIVKVTREVVR